MATRALRLRRPLLRAIAAQPPPRTRSLASSSGGTKTMLAALVERSPQLTPDLPDYELRHRESLESS